jgi:hypothetical protein
MTPQIPPYLITFAAAALALVLAAILVRSAWKARARRDEGRKRIGRLRDALEELRVGAELQPGVFGIDRIATPYEGTSFTLGLPNENSLRVIAIDPEEADPLESLPWVIRWPARPAWLFPMAWAWLTPLGRRKLDPEFEFYLPGTLYGYLRELDSVTQVEAPPAIHTMDDVLRLDKPMLERLAQRVGTDQLWCALDLSRARRLFELLGLSKFYEPPKQIEAEQAQKAVIEAARALMEPASPATRGALVESLTVLRSLKGVRRFRLECTGDAVLSATLDLSSDELLVRPDQLESLLHHLRQLRVMLSAG